MHTENEAEIGQNDGALSRFRRGLVLFEGLGSTLRKALELYEKVLPFYTEARDNRRIDLTTQNIRALQSAIEKGES